ncbi:hypothetical protein, partial [Vibrio parahaemolyticus]|uniref:hypothetical protein n=1 Tax=Vibrio parahaemolyticus TaxID=670 RepID=UPI002114A02F
VLDALTVSQTALGAMGLSVRLDTPVTYLIDENETVTETVMDAVARTTGLTIGVAENGNKPMRCLLLNGRQYLETTRLDH